MRRRLLLGYLSLAILVLVALEVPLAVSYARNERDNLTTKVERDAVALGSILEDSLSGTQPASSGALGDFVGRYTQETGGRVIVVDATGTGLVDTESPGAASRSFASRPEIAAALAGEVATGERHSVTLDENLLYVAVPVASGGVVHGAVRITYPTSEVDGRVHRYWAILALIGGVVLTAATLVGLRFARAVAGPLGRLETAARQAGAGDLGVRAPVEGPPEVRSLARSFNEMVATLAELVRSQREFVADASHQLRTPLAALRLRLENLEYEISPGGREGIDAALAEVGRLSRLTDGLLALARADSGATSRETIDLEGMVAGRKALWSDLAVARGVSIDTDVARGCAAAATPGRLEQVLDNLIENALAVAPAGTAVKVTASSSAAGAEVRVVDAGPGLTPAERARAFDRFWRADAKGAAGGSGLGLAIVARLVEADGGTVELHDAPGGGLAAVVRLPAVAEGPAASAPGEERR